MKKIFVILTAVLVSLISATVSAAPTCVMMKFTNDTRYQNIDSAALLSDLVMEKLLARTNLNFIETRPLDEDLEMQLYDEKTRDILATETGAKRGNFNILFENGTFDKNHAQSIATAEVGQIVSPAITSKIGSQHGAEYLIQGTIISMGNSFNRSEVTIPIPIPGGVLFGSFDEKTSVIGVVVDVRLIKASTGEVIWKKTATGTKSNANVANLVGSSKLNSEMYVGAMQNCVDEIVKIFKEDLTADKLFVK